MPDRINRHRSSPRLVGKVHQPDAECFIFAQKNTVDSRNVTSNRPVINLALRQFDSLLTEFQQPFDESAVPDIHIAVYHRRTMT